MLAIVCTFNEMPHFSVVIPAYNREVTIGATLASIAAQEFRDFECIVVDDGSTDATCKIVQEFDFAKLSRQNNAGPGAARNLGVEMTTGKYIAFLDSDDLWFPWTLETYSQLVQQYDSPAVISAAITEFADRAMPADVRRTPTASAWYDDFLSAQLVSDCFVGAGMTVVRRDVFKRAGGFTDAITNCEDHDLMLRLGDAKGFVRTEQPITLAWRRHQGGTTQDLGRTIRGVEFLIKGEHDNRYPGGKTRRSQRRVFLTARVRPVILDCLSHGYIRKSLHLFRLVFYWLFSQGRAKFMAGFFLRLTGALLRKTKPSPKAS
jgi:glycosyltransferase involved in cell wall biosynthesis